MNKIDLAKFRLESQQIAGTQFNTEKNIVAWMGAMQAQDYAMAKWAIGVRLPNSTDRGICAAIDNGDIIRTHILRPTWHFVSCDDIYWMLELTAQQIKASFKSRNNELGLSPAVLRKSNAVIEKALIGEKHLTREELIAELGHANIATDQNRASHIFAWAELEGLICSGPTKGGKQTYAILEERVLKKGTFNKDESLATLTKKYFSSRCPATLQDFIWWSGLSVSDAKHAMDMTGAEFIAEIVDSQTYWFPKPYSTQKADRDRAYLLPAFDEFIISYKDRSASLPPGTPTKAITNNGIFRPVVVVNGQVVGIWSRTIWKKQVFVEVELFDTPSKAMRNHIKEASEYYGGYLEKNTELKFNF
jgi:hypothetical protein